MEKILKNLFVVVLFIILSIVVNIIALDDRAYKLEILTDAYIDSIDNYYNSKSFLIGEGTENERIVMFILEEKEKILDISIDEIKDLNKESECLKVK
jgi:hypothetical protein